MASFSRFMSLGSLTAALLIPTATAFALPPLETFLAAGREYALDNRSAEARVDVRRAEREDARSRLLPAINATGTYARNQYNIVPLFPIDPASPPQNVPIQPRNTWDTLFTLEVPIFDLAQLRRTKAARLGIEVASLEVEASKLTVDTQVVRAYYQVLDADAIAASARQAESVARENLRVVEQRVNAGLASSLDRERASAEVEARSQAVAEAEYQGSISRRQLRTLTGIDVEREEEVARFEVELEGDPARETFLAALENIPQVRAADARVELARANQRTARSLFAPTVHAYANEHITNAYGFAFPRQWRIEFVARFRLDFTKQAQVALANANATVVDIDDERARINATNAINDAYDLVIANRAKAEAARAQVAAATQAASVAQQRYGAGSASQLDVIQANRDAFDAEVRRVTAEAELAYAREVLRIVANLGAR